MRPIVWCAPDVTVSAAASAMTDAGQSCALIQRGDQFGIVTDSDFRAGLATGTLTTHTPVAGLASFPAATIGPDTLVGDAFLRMVESGYHHLVVTGAGEKPIGILRVVDLASAEVRNPLVIRRAVDDAANLNDLAAAAALLPSTWLELYDTGVSVMHIAALLSAVIDAVMLRLIDLTDIGEDAVPNRTSWLLLGSVARREPLPRSDVDTALVWDDHTDAAPRASCNSGPAAYWTTWNGAGSRAAPRAPTPRIPCSPDQNPLSSTPPRPGSPTRPRPKRCFCPRSLPTAGRSPMFRWGARSPTPC